MRRLLLAALLAFPLVALAASRTVTLDVPNMTCGLCPITVTKALQQVPGVSAVKVDLDSKTATVAYDPEQAPAAALTRATADAGYPSTVRR